VAAKANSSIGVPFPGTTGRSEDHDLSR
jgi:hypothetical protein